MKQSVHHPALRWFSVVLRGFHLAAVIGLGAAILGAPLSLHLQSIYVFLTGIVMFAFDLWKKPYMMMEWSGVALVIKLVVITLMAFSAELRLPLFWCVVIWSVIFAHAPASFRHATWRR